MPTRVAHAKPPGPKRVIWVHHLITNYTFNPNVLFILKILHQHKWLKYTFLKILTCSKLYSQITINCITLQNFNEALARKKGNGRHNKFGLQREPVDSCKLKRVVIGEAIVIDNGEVARELFEDIKSEIYQSVQEDKFGIVYTKINKFKGCTLGCVNFMDKLVWKKQ